MRIGIGMALTAAAGAPLGVQSASAEVTGATEITFTLTTSYAYAGVAIRVSGSGGSYLTWFLPVQATSHTIVLDAADGILAGTTYEWYPYVTNDPLDAEANRVRGTGGTVAVPAAGRTDNFTRANSTTTLGTPSDGGSAWVAQTGTWGINSNAGYCVTVTPNATAVLETSLSNVAVSITISTRGTFSGPVARAADANNFLMGVAEPGQLSMYKRVGGTFTQLSGSYFGAVADGDVLILRVNSSNLIEFVQNGVVRVSATDSAGSGNTLCGWYASNDTTVRFDDLSVVAN